jgi:copper chaperone
MINLSYSVIGMTCSHCVAAVSEEVGKIPGVAEVGVDLASGTVEIISTEPIDRSAVAEAVEEAGYALAS